MLCPEANVNNTAKTGTRFTKIAVRLGPILVIPSNHQMLASAVAGTAKYNTSRLSFQDQCRGKPEGGSIQPKGSRHNPPTRQLQADKTSGEIWSPSRRI